MRIDSSGAIWKVAYFRDVESGSVFWCNGNKWRKTSSRTARGVSDGLPASAMYFRQNEICETQVKTQDAITGRHAVRVYTLDGIKDGTVRFNGDGPAEVETLDGTVRVRVPRLVAKSKLDSGDCIYTC